MQKIEVIPFKEFVAGTWKRPEEKNAALEVLGGLAFAVALAYLVAQVPNMPFMPLGGPLK